MKEKVDGLHSKKIERDLRRNGPTLHFYEEAGLLKPAYYGSNGYRYYEEKELLQLQQILFFKELGLTLKQIRKILGKNDFDQITALHSHRKALSCEWEKIGKQLKSKKSTKGKGNCALSMRINILAINFHFREMMMTPSM